MHIGIMLQQCGKPFPGGGAAAKVLASCSGVCSPTKISIETHPPETQKPPADVQVTEPSLLKRTVHTPHSSEREPRAARPMNAHALLTAQGWRGTGHSLHPTDDRTGLTHHILIKRNQDGSGLGSKKDHKQEAWWLNAFDQALKGIDVKSGTMKQTLKGGALEKITARNATTKYTGARGLYTSFVRGGVMEGSADEPAASLPTPPDSGAGTPLGQEPETKIGEREETREEKKARREAKKLKKAEKAEKAEKEAQREAQRRAAQKVEKKKAKKAERQAAKEKLKVGETKEERRARRDARRRRKEEKRLMRAAKG
ncbi:hypothetical protein F5B21DRAFT_345867 [Xylaria acuta]|nr:hypothetical protein F5B21DRAFT_345867 [Xylaria acuta]